MVAKTTLVIWIFTIHICGIEVTAGPFYSERACWLKLAELVKTILGPQAFGECEKQP
jgi:hypothetical protein